MTSSGAPGACLSPVLERREGARLAWRLACAWVILRRIGGGSALGELLARPVNHVVGSVLGISSASFAQPLTWSSLPFGRLGCLGPGKPLSPGGSRSMAKQHACEDA
jgi:hypothetical protein